MRICIDISQTVYEGTGSGRYVVELVKELLAQDQTNEYVLFGSAMRRRSQLVSLVALLKDQFPKSHITPKLFYFPPKFFEIMWNRLHILPLELFTGPVEVYHSSDWVEAPSKAKRVTTVHDLIPFLYPAFVHPRIRDAHILRWKRILAEEDCIIVDAEVTKKDISSRFSFPSEKIAVIPLACDARFFEIGAKRIEGTLKSDEQIAEVLARYTLQFDSYLLCVGTLEPRKNIQRLIKAYSQLDAHVREKYPLVIVGKKSWSSDFDSTQGVIFTGYVTDTDLPYLYGAAKCFIMPSFYEGFGFPVLEAMASGAPVISSNISSLPEIGGEEVHYIEDSESIESMRLIISHVLASPIEELSLVAKSAYTRAKTFSWKKTAARTLEIYKNLVK